MKRVKTHVSLSFKPQTSQALFKEKEKCDELLLSGLAATKTTRSQEHLDKPGRAEILKKERRALAKNVRTDREKLNTPQSPKETKNLAQSR